MLPLHIFIYENEGEKMARKYAYITSAEREVIAKLYEENFSVYEIAERVGRRAPVIYQELMRGYTGQTDNNSRPAYDPALSEQRMQENLHKRGGAKKHPEADHNQRTLYDTE